MIYLNAIPGDPSANSYADLPTALAFLTQARLYCPEWVANGITDDTRSTALIWATSLLDKLMDPWNGYKATRQQNLRWPRSACYDPDGFYVDKTIIPVKIQEITIQFAWELLKQNRLQEVATLGTGISGQVAVGPIRVDLDPKNFLPFLPLYLQAELGPWGMLTGIGEKGMRVLKLLRT